MLYKHTPYMESTLTYSCRKTRELQKVVTVPMKQLLQLTILPEQPAVCVSHYDSTSLQNSLLSIV